MHDELSPSQVAGRLGTTTRTVQRWIVSGRLPARRLGSRWRVANDAIVALLESKDPATAALARATLPIRSLFIANRGEIASRIARTCDRLGIRATLPDTEGPGAVDLLDAPSVVAAAVATGADAVHPGVGFLAESAEFAERVLAAGLRWVGPPPEAIRRMGDKAAARRLARSLAIPVLDGYDDPDQSDGSLVAGADRIGYPLLVKPAAGGGGKGMRIVRQPERLAEALHAARREASAAFGDDRLILERLVEGARHIEVQVLFDGFGHGVQLGERDCSIQRRHQKILEEAPSPFVDERLRARLAEAALGLARAVGYVSAGTCEFLVDERGRFFFLEMNTRLQVEHPVTELVTGRDLVADQLGIAAGMPVEDPGVDQGLNGHAVEVRLYAEDAEAGFLPAFGRVELLRWPAGGGIRVDAGIDASSEISGRFDPMLAKLIAWGPDRATALTRLAQGLDQAVVLGLVTNLRFLRWLVRQPVVQDGQARTDTLDRIWPPDDWAARTAIPDEAWGVAARALTAASDQPTDPWTGGWRVNGARVVRLEADGEERSVEVPGATDEAILLALAGDHVHLDLAGRSTAFRFALPPDIDRAAHAAVAHGAGATGASNVMAPMPGAVIAVHVKPGDSVEIGDSIVTLEAMKMEHVVAAPVTGRVTDVLVELADQVTRGQVLAAIEP
jgi:excisionase family DNA binding protein